MLNIDQLRYDYLEPVLYIVRGSKKEPIRRGMYCYMRDFTYNDITIFDVHLDWSYNVYYVSIHSVDPWWKLINDYFYTTDDIEEIILKFLRKC